MTNEELNRLAAVHIMKWRLYEAGANSAWCYSDGGEAIEFYMWKPASVESQALALYYEVRDKYSMSITWNGHSYFVNMEYLPPLKGVAAIECDKDSLPTAIIRAILKAEGVL